MADRTNTPFYIWLALGASYLIVKLIWVGAGYLHLGAISHGAVPAVIMLAFGLWFWRNQPRGAVWLLILPLLTLIITPPFMYWKQGGAEWLTNGRGSVLVVYTLIALVQAWIGRRIWQRLR
ncbi:MAG: hypothetical protein CR993_01965 [Rhodobacterales bacterium]|nr:MAG: hypothetical protein CR993_01965 [Rhodobacterales bacterium]